MDARQYAAIVVRLDDALKAAGIAVTQGFVENGQVTRWDTVPTAQLLAWWIKKAYRIELVVPSDIPARVLALHRESPT